MKKKIAIALAILVVLGGIIYIYKNQEHTPRDTDTGLTLHRLDSSTEEELKARVDREVDRGIINDLADLELMEKLYPDNKAYKKALFTTYYDQDPNKGLQYAGKAFMETQGRDILKLLENKTSKTFKYSQDSRYEVLREIAEETAGKIFGTWKDIFLSPYFNADAPYYLKNVIQVELMDGPDGNLYILTYGNTPFQETISKGKKIDAKEAEIYKISKDGEVSFVTKLVNDDKDYREVIYKKVGSNLEFYQSTSIVNLESEIAFIGASVEEVTKLNQEILTNLEHNSLVIDWTGYENLAPFAKAYMEEVFKIKNLNSKKAQGEGKNQSILKKGFLVDLDKDGVLDLVLLTSHISDNKMTQGLYIYTYSDNQAVNIYSYEDLSTEDMAYNFHLDAGLLEENGQTYVYIAHTGDSGYFVNTNLGLLSKEKGANIVYQEEGYSNVAYMTYLSADGKSNEYEETSFVQNSTYIKPNQVKSFEEGYYGLRDRIFGKDANLFITDAKAQVNPSSLKEGETGVENFEYPARDSRGNLIYEGYDDFLTEDQLLSLLLIPVEQPVDFPIIRRFRIGDQIYPADILKIRADSTGHINASIFKDHDQISLKMEGDTLVIEKDGKTYQVKKPMVDEENNYYIPFATFKEMGLIARDQGYIVDLAFDGMADIRSTGQTYEAIKEKIDGEISKGKISSLEDLELVSVIEEDPTYKLERVKAYKEKSPDQAAGYAKDLYLGQGSGAGLKILDGNFLRTLKDEDQREDYLESLGKNSYLKDANKAYIEKIVDLYESTRDEENKIEPLGGGLVFDLDQDGSPELFLKITLEDEILILGYSYDGEDEDLVEIFTESIDRRLNQYVDFGVSTKETQPELFILEDYRDNLSRTWLRTYTMEDDTLELDEEAYKTFDEGKNETTYSYEISKDMENDSQAEKDFLALKERLFGDAEVYFYSDGSAKDVSFSKYPDSYRVDMESLLRFLNMEDIIRGYRPAVIRRFMVEDLIYPPKSLLISPDSKGYVDLRILGQIPGLEIKETERTFVLLSDGREEPLDQIITDESGLSYISLDHVKDLGLVKEDRGPIIVLGK